MALKPDQIIVRGRTDHLHEVEAIDFIIGALPPTEPYRLWGLVEFTDGQGRRYEIDALVMGYHALYLIEIKSHPARVTGNSVDWTFTFSDGGRTTRENPLKLTAQKARVLASLLDRKLKHGIRRPFVEPLVFLSHVDARVDLDESGRVGVVTRETLARALTRGEVPGTGDRLISRGPVDRPSARETTIALKSLGLEASAESRRVGELFIGKLIEEGPGYQDFEAEHETLKTRRRVRTYLTPQAATAERREQLQRAALREAGILSALSENRRVLRLLDYVPAGLGGAPSLIFEHAENALPLDAFIRSHPELPYLERVELIQQVGEALAYCHRKDILHRNLHPGSVLVQRGIAEKGGAEGPLEIRLFNFQLASHAGEGTVHLSTLTSDPAVVYRAPEVIENPSSASTASDIFSLGCLAFFVLTGQPPGADLAERNRRLEAGDNKLSLSTVSDKLGLVKLGGADEFASLDEVIGFATDARTFQRADDAMDWVNLLLDSATDPGARAQTADPLTAIPGETLEGGYVIERILGRGSTSRVLLVKRANESFALKVPLDEEAEERLLAEAGSLEKVQGQAVVPFVVALKERKKFNGQTCLLLGHAGTSLAEHLSKHGTPALDYAKRWGEDLLRALELLEEKGVQHRDIKPANLGILEGASKRARNLVLIDFSLSAADSRSVTAGTPAYRDPFLVNRNHWDAAADRWAAAITLYEMLTGVRPQFGNGTEAATAISDEITLEPERFEATARKKLESFFRRALARDLERRHHSAEAMRAEWVACFAAVTEPASATTPPQDRAAQLAGMTTSTSIDALGLSGAARSALDRAGLVTVKDVLSLPRNRLSVMRGVARQTAEEILKFIEDFQKAHPDGLDAVEAAFRPEFRGLPVPLSEVDGFPAALRNAFADAGLIHLGAVAAAPKSHVERIVERDATFAATLEHAFVEATEAARAPETIEGWLDKLFPSVKSKDKQKSMLYAKLLLGLVSEEGLSRPAEAKEIARRHGVSPQNIYLSFRRIQDSWLKREDLSSLLAPVRQLVESAGGVGRLDELARQLVAVLPHAPGRGEDEDAGVRAQALVRIAGELDDSVTVGRIDRELWVTKSELHLAALRTLGRDADDIAGEAVLPSADEVRERLSVGVKHTPLSALPLDRLVHLAARASRNAAVSARLEIYPRGMEAKRAILLCAPFLSGAEPTADEVHQVLTQRYPEAQKAPVRPELDELMKELQLRFDEEGQRYRRADGRSVVSSATHVLSSRASTTHSTVLFRARTPDVESAFDFEDKLRLALERRAFRVLEVLAPYADEAVGALRERAKLSETSIDRELWNLVRATMHKRRVDERVVFEADRNGPNDPSWNRLRTLMKEASEALLKALLARDEPLLLVHPGLLARYQLDGLLQEILDASLRDERPAIFLVNPIHDRAGPQPIQGSTGSIVVPTSSPAQVLRIPPSWIENKHRGAA